MTFLRSYPLADVSIRSGTGRTVEAFAAVFDRPAEVADHEGHYQEQIAPSAFDRTLASRRPSARNGNRWGVAVIYNHGLTLHGTPSERGAIPIATVKDIRAERVGDVHGLLTVSEYLKHPDADAVLEGIREGAITAQSFRGTFRRSNPARPPRAGYRAAADGTLPLVTRHEVNLVEFGPTPMPVYAEAAVVSVRAHDLYNRLATLEPEDREELLDLLGTRSGGAPADHGTPDPGRTDLAAEFLRLRGAARTTLGVLL